MHISRNLEGEIIYTGNEDDFLNQEHFPLANETLEVDLNKTGIGFCFIAKEHQLYQVESNEAELYHPVCFIQLVFKTNDV